MDLPPFWPSVGILGGLLLGLDGVFKQLATTRKLWRGGVAAVTYLRDLFNAPMKIRALEKWRDDSAQTLDPVRHLGAVWFPSDVESGKSDAYCQSCWVEGNRIALQCNAHEKHVYMTCRHNTKHGATQFERCLVVDEEKYRDARDHVYDVRRAKGA